MPVQIYDTDLATRGSGLQLTGSTEASDRFCSLAWGSLGLDTGALPVSPSHSQSFKVHVPDVCMHVSM